MDNFMSDSSTITISLITDNSNDNQLISLASNETAASSYHENVIKPPETFSIAETIIIALITGCFSIITIVGNVMVMISFKMDKQLQTISNYFLLSLSIADFLIGIISMPLFSLYTLLERWPLGPFICDTWLAIDYLISNASVLNLLIISFDRYFSVTRPLTYRARRTTKKACIMIATTWIISLLLWPPWIFSWPYIEGKRTVPKDECYIQFLETNSYITFGTAIAAFYIPLFVMMILYWRIWRETEKRYRDLTTLFLVSTVGASKASSGGGGGGSGNGFSGNRGASAGGGLIMLSRKNTSSSSEGQVITTTTSIDKRSSSLESKSVHNKRAHWWLCWTKSNQFSDCDDRSEGGSTVDHNVSRGFSYKLSHRKNNKKSKRDHSGLKNSKNNNINNNNNRKTNNNKSNTTNNNNNNNNNNSNKDNTMKNSVTCGSHNKMTLRDDDISPSQTSTGTGDPGDSLKGSESIYTIVIKLYGDEDHNHTIKMIEHSDTIEPSKSLYSSGSAVADQRQPQPQPQPPPQQHHQHHHQFISRYSSHQYTHQHSIEQGSTSSGSTIAKSPGNLSMSGSGSNPRRLTSNPSGTSIHPQQPKSERKAAKTLSAILLAFAITWTPYNVLVLINSLAGSSADDEKTVPKSLWDFCYYLCYINSTINPLCYALCNATFRRTYIRILKCKWSSKKNKQHRRQKHWNLE